MRIIEVVEHNREWEHDFSAESERISASLSECLTAIHHIGSTSVPGLRAKPTIDILATVNSLECAGRLTGELESIGYEPYGEHGIPGRLFFVKTRYLNSTDWVNDFHLHVFLNSDEINIRRHIAVREFLRSHQERAAEYGKLKMELSRSHPNDPDGYVDGKDDFMKRLESDALKWYSGTV